MARRHADALTPGAGSKDRPSGARPAQAPETNAPPSAGRLLALQQTAGNRAVAGMLANARGSGASGGGASGNGGGGAVKPSTFATDVAGVVQATSAAQDQAGGTATSVLAAATTPAGPPVAPEADVPDPPGGAGAAAGSAGPTPPAPAASDSSLATTATTSGLASHERAEGDALTTAGSEVAQQAAAVQVGPLGATQPVGHLPAGTLPPAARLPDAGGAGKFPTLEPEVAQVLDQGFGGQLSAKAADVAQQREQAVADHDQTATQAKAAHDATVAAEQAAAEGQARQVQDQARQDIAAHKSAWADQGRQAAAAGQAELRSLRAGAVADVENQAGQANSQASQIMTTAHTQSAQQGGTSGPPVQRSLWGRIRSAAGRAIGAARDGLSSLAGAARGLVEGALNRVRELFDSVRQAIADRIGRYVQAARDLAGRVRSRMQNFAQAAMSGIRRAVSWARSTVNRITAGLRALGGRLLDGLRSAFRRAAGWLADRFRGLVNGLLSFGRFILSLAGKVRQLLKVASSKVLKGIARAVEDPAAFLAPYKAQVGQMIDAVPTKAGEMYDKHVAPLIDGGGATARPATTAAAGPTVQRQPDDHDQEPGDEQPSHGAIVKEYLKDRLAYLGSNWGSVILNVLLEIFVPGLTLYRHLPAAVKAVAQALKDLFAGRVSDAVDQGLKAAREQMAMLATLFAQVSIAAFIAGSILGTPIVGEAAMFAVGMGLLAADVVLQGASIAKARSNLDRPDRTPEQLNEDYSNIADSIFSLGITFALILIAVAGMKLGKYLLGKFPRVANALTVIRDRLRAGLRRRLGIDTPPSGRGPVRVPGEEPGPPGFRSEGSRPGTEPTPASIQEGSVRMEAHPRYAETIQGLQDQGIKVVPTTGDPQVFIRRVVDPQGNVLRTEIEVRVRPGMRFLDLEHEVGHVRQVTDRARFPEGPPPLEIVVETPGQATRRASSQAGTVNTWQNAVIEYHNRLDEFIRLSERGASQEVMRQHLSGVDHWAREYHRRVLAGSKLRWAQERFPDIPELERKAKDIAARVRGGGTPGAGGAPAGTSATGGSEGQ